MRFSIMAMALCLATGPVLAHEGHGHDQPGSVPHAQALGRPGNPDKVSRTVEVSMSDEMRFTPSTLVVKRNETIRFVVKNNGKQKHEMVLGTLAELKQHAALMRKFPGMEHEDPNAVTVEPSSTGTIVWQFTRAGNFDFACLIPGHFEAGMKGKISVSR